MEQSYDTVKKNKNKIRILIRSDFFRFHVAERLFSSLLLHAVFLRDNFSVLYFSDNLDPSVAL